MRSARAATRASSSSARASRTRPRWRSSSSSDRLSAAMAEPDYATMKERARKMWALGDYPKIAAILHDASRSLVDAGAISAGHAMLDVAARTADPPEGAAEGGGGRAAHHFSPGPVTR